MNSKKSGLRKLLSGILISAVIVTIFLVLFMGLIKTAIVNADPVKAYATVLNIKTDFSMSHSNSNRWGENQNVFNGRVQILYFYEFKGKVYQFDETFSYSDVLGLLENKQTVLGSLEDVKYLPVWHSAKYPSIHIFKIQEY